MNGTVYFGFLSEVNWDFYMTLPLLVLVLLCNVACQYRTGSIYLIFFASFTIGFFISLTLGELDTKMLEVEILADRHRYMEFAIMPPVIFACSVAFDPQDFKKVGWQFLILVGPCFLWSTLFCGCVVFAYWYWTLPIADISVLTLPHIFMLSSFISVTDPVTVNHLADEMDVSYQISTLLKLESLISPVSAFLFNGIIQLTFDVSIIAELIQDLSGLCGSTIAGYIYARVLTTALSRLLYTDYIGEAGLAMVMMYVSYFTGHMVHGSSVLCVSVFAITFNSCRNKIGQRTYDDLKRFWVTVAYCASGILIAFNGFFAGLVLNGEIKNKNRFVPLIGIIPASVLCRFVSILTFTPLLRYAGGFELEHVCVFVAAGLRSFVPQFLVLQHFYRQLGDRDTADEVRQEQQTTVMIAYAVLFAVAGSYLFQGLFAYSVAKCLGIQVKKSRAQSEFLRNLAERVNQQNRDKINARKQQPENADICWNLIEKEMVFKFGDLLDQTKRSTRNEMAKGDYEKYKRLEEKMDETDSRERVQHCYEAQLRKIWRGSGRASSAASRSTENAILEAAFYQRAVDIESIFNSLQPTQLLRRVATFGREWTKNSCLQKMLTALSIYETVWRWRLFICALSAATGGLQIYSAVTASKKPISGMNFYFFALFSFALSLEQIGRTFYLIRTNHRLRGGSVLKTVWFWFEITICVTFLVSDGIHIACASWCIDKMSSEPMVVLTKTSFCRGIRIALIVDGGQLLLQVPLIIGLFLHLVFAEAQKYVHDRDEDTFEALNGLLAATDIVLRLLAGRTLVQKPILKKKLSDECLALKYAAEDKLIELMSRQGGHATLASIKTRHAAREIIEEIGSLLKEANDAGILRDFEYSCMDGVVSRMRANVQTLHEPRTAQLQDSPHLTNAMAMEILESFLKQMEWMKAARDELETKRMLNQLKSGGRLETFKKWANIIQQSTTSNERGFYILLNGFCRSANYDYSNEDIDLLLLHPGSTFGENAWYNEPHFETVTVASSTVKTVWFSQAVIENLPIYVQEAFSKFMVEKSCVHYLRQDERFHAWSDEMLRQYVRRILKLANGGDTVSSEARTILLFKGALKDSRGKSFQGNPCHPVKLGKSTEYSFQGPLSVPLNAEGAYYMVTASSQDSSESELGDSFLMMDLASVISGSSVSSTIAGKFRPHDSIYKKFKSPYRKLKPKKKKE